MNPATYLERIREIATKLERAMSTQNMTEVADALRESKNLDREYINQSGFREGARLTVEKRTAVILADPVDVIHRGAIVCDLRFLDNNTEERVGVIPKWR